MIAVMLSLLSVGLFVVLWAGVSVLTVVRAARRARQRPRELGPLRHWYPESELARLDEALARILAEEQGAPTRSRSGQG
jgi:hypothetical protein